MNEAYKRLLLSAGLTVTAQASLQAKSSEIVQASSSGRGYSLEDVEIIRSADEGENQGINYGVWDSGCTNNGSCRK